jgi:hypothetical protein
MPSRKNKRTTATVKRTVQSRQSHSAFFPLLLLVLMIWVLYRSLFHFPVWFDETIGKAIFLGLPVSLYISLANAQEIRKTYTLDRFYRGLFLGVAVGGIFGFAATLTTFFSRGVLIQSAPLFTSNAFWWEFFLALMTGFWESLFFFCWVMVIIQEKYRHWGLFTQVLLVAAVFVIFHIPNTLLRASSMGIVVNQVILLSIFAIGQALFFTRTKNLYALAISQAIWGMVLLVHTTY